MAQDVANPSSPVGFHFSSNCDHFPARTPQALYALGFLQLLMHISFSASVMVAVGWLPDGLLVADTVEDEAMVMLEPARRSRSRSDSTASNEGDGATDTQLKSSLSGEEVVARDFFASLPLVSLAFCLRTSSSASLSSLTACRCTSSNQPPLLMKYRGR